MNREFENGYGISVIDFGYGSNVGKLEALVYLKADHHAAIAPKVLADLGMSANPQGWLTREQADALTRKVSKLVQWSLFYRCWPDDDGQTSFTMVKLTGNFACVHDAQSHVDEFYPATHCEHSHDCCGGWYSRRASVKFWRGAWYARQYHYCNV